MTHRRALHLLEPFRLRIMPGLLQRLLRWKGLDLHRNTDLIDDLSQELFLDCIQNSAEIQELPPRERHSRWLRVMDRYLYRLHVRANRMRDFGTLVEFISAEGSQASRAESDLLADCQIDLPPTQQQFIRQLCDRGSYMKNGRINSRKSASALGLRECTFKHAWGEAAAELGLDEEFVGFWSRRLVEALVGLAADLLRDEGKVQVHAEAQRRRPDPKGRLQRIRKLREALASIPLPSELKSVMSHYRRGPLLRSPRQILDDAALLHPSGAAVQLWSFEAALAEGDHGAAALALRRARRTDAEPVRILLARIRLLQARDRGTAARWLLARRPDSDPRLSAARRALGG